MPRNIAIKLEDAQSGFHHGRSSTEQIFILRPILEKSWDYAKDV